MKNVLYVGPYRQNDEWGITSRALVSSLSKNENINLCIRPIWFNQDHNLIDIGSLSKYENKKVLPEQKEILIQHGIPTYLNYNGDFQQNIIALSLDCGIENTSWADHIELFDKVLVFSDNEKKLLEKSNIKTPAFSFKHPPLFENFNMNNLNFQFQGVKFYAKVSLDQKSSLEEIATSYLSAFKIPDNALLTLCVSQNEAEKVASLLDEIKTQLGINTDHDYYNDIAVAPIEDIETMNYIHNVCDYFIDCSYNCRIGQDLLRSIAFGSTPIVLDTCSEFTGEDYDFLVQSNDEIIRYERRPLRNLYSGEGSWKTPNTLSLKEILKFAYQTHGEQRKRIPINNDFKESIEELLCI
tara:strand:- start:1272 stop:2333 length:1062 start_codon:yes stop_codon:yes gene_type:complete